MTPDTLVFAVLIILLAIELTALAILLVAFVRPDLIEPPTGSATGGTYPSAESRACGGTAIGASVGEGADTGGHLDGPELYPDVLPQESGDQQGSSEYECPECGATTCLTVSYTDDRVTGCSSCGYGDGGLIP